MLFAKAIIYTPIAIVKTLRDLRGNKLAAVLRDRRRAVKHVGMLQTAIFIAFPGSTRAKFIRRFTGIHRIYNLGAESAWNSMAFSLSSSPSSKVQHCPQTRCLCVIHFEFYHPKHQPIPNSSEIINPANMYASKAFLAMLFAMTASAAVTPRAAAASSAACNTARVGVVSALASAGTAVDGIQDAQVKAAAQKGLDQANTGVNEVAQSIVAGQAPSAAGRDDVEAGLKAMIAALDGGDA